MAVLFSFRWLILGWCLLLVAQTAPAQAPAKAPAKPADKPHFRPEDSLNVPAFEHFYNLDYEHSIQELEQVRKRHPDDPFAVNHLLTAVLFQELDRMGALNTGEYANDSFVTTPHRPPDPKAQKQIKELVEQALQLEAKRLAANESDIDAIYARGVTRAQFATYTALVERAWFSALRNAVGARRDHERVLELNPNYADAKLIVGAHNYVMGSLSWAVKVAVSMVGLSGNKEKGLQYLREAAANNGESGSDAKIVLVLFLRREKLYDEALQYARGLITSYPRNYLLALEEGNLLRAAGRNAEAAVAYRKVWQAGKDGKFPGLHYELAALSLGDLLRFQKDYYGAWAAYDLVSTVDHPDPEISQKANLAAGEACDLIGKRDVALKHYQAVIATDGGTPLAETARKRLQEPFKG